MAIKKKEKTLEEVQRQLRQQIAARIQEIRLKKGHKAAEKFAILNDIDRKQYGKYERGIVDMRISSLAAVLKALDISITEFFSEGFE